MPGYEPSESDIQAIIEWLKINRPKDANREFALSFLYEMRTVIRDIGRANPDKLYELLEVFEPSQNGKTSEE